MLRLLLLIPLLVVAAETKDIKSGETHYLSEDIKSDETHYLPVDWVNQIIAFKGTPSYLYAATYFGVYKSKDNAVTWQTENDGLESLLINALLITDYRLYAATDEGVFTKKIDSSLWEKVGSDNLVYSLANLGTTVYAGTIDRIWRSRDYGKSWELAKEGVGAILSIVATGGCILAVSYEKGVFVS